MVPAALALAERGWVPLPLLRRGVRRLLAQRIADLEREDPQTTVAALRHGPIAIDTAAANEQHYELPPAFFATVLGPRLKYSGCYWPPGVSSLAEAEVAALDQVCDRADLRDGQSVLELGCGWGSLTVYMAQRFPRSRIVAVSNSAPQRSCIEAHALPNVTVITEDMNAFEPSGRFDRIVSVEMFEHMRNYRRLLARIAQWLERDGRLFVHLFCHRSTPYLFGTEGAGNWMGRHFFSGGLMPSRTLLDSFDDDLYVESDWAVDGTHYARTAAAWRRRHETSRPEVMELFADVYGAAARRWYHRWRLFFLACEELFAFRGGREWLVGHYRLAPRSGAAGSGVPY